MKREPPSILFPTDFESHSKAAFSHAVHLAADAGYRLIALHVANQPDMCGSQADGPSYHEEFRERLNEYSSDLVDVERQLRVADPGPEICRVAREEQCQLVFMGITNKVGMDQLGLGSVNDYVLHYAPCPVVTFRQQPSVRSGSRASVHG